MQQHPKVYDEAKLVGMAEPLNVRIERLKNNTRSPIPIPDHDDGSPGAQGWSQDEVRKIDNWLVSEWAGGGLYEVTITDSTLPTPIIMRWQPFYDPREYPEKTPPTLAGASAGRPQAPTPLHRQVSVAAFPNGLPSNPYAQQQQPLQQQPFFAPSFQQATLPQPPPVGSNSWPQWQAEAERQRRDDELKTLREQAALREREATEARHRAELDRIRVENDSKAAAAQRTVDTQLAEMRSMIAGLTVTLKEGNARPAGPDPAIVALQEQNRLLAAQAENERRERDAERRERELKELMRTTNEATQRQIEMMTKQFEDRTRALTENRGPDPMLSMFKEIVTGTQREQADALKEISRNHAAQVERLQTFMMSPQQMMMMAKEANAESAASTERVTKFFGSVVEMQQKATEHILSIQPGGSGVIDVVREGIGGLKEFAERYVGAKERTEKLSMTAQAQIATAQANAMQAQAMAQAGLGGMPMNQNGHNHGATIVQPEQAQIPAAPPLTVEALQPKSPARLWGRTDEEWFGPILDEVEQLRAGVVYFLESCRMDPIRVGPDGQPDGVRPEQAMVGVMTAVQEIANRQVSIAAIIDLFAKGQLAEFIGVLLPDAPQAYRDDLRGLIDAELRKMASGETPDDDDGDGEGEDDEPAVEPTKPVAHAAPTIVKLPVKPTSPARRA